MTNFREVTECRACGSPFLYKFIDLGDQPLANAFHGSDEILEGYPLAVNVCKTCYHTQLTVTVNPDILFKNYLYVSGTSKTLEEYFEWFAQVQESFVSAIHRANKSDKQNFRVLDIACNDGSQLKQFRKLGWMTYGVDPAQNLAKEAQANCDFFYNDYWNDGAATWLKQKLEEEPLDLIVAQNVFAHTDDILQFLLDCKKVMSHKTLLVIQTSQANMYVNREFDTIYHEHLSFFNTKSMKAICERAGLKLHRVDKTKIHGISYVFYIGAHLLLPDNMKQTIKDEKKCGLYKLATYVRYGLDSQDTLRELRYQLCNLYKDGWNIVGYGAAAKSMTVLNAMYVDNAKNPEFKYIVDENPLKQGLFTPGTNIPVVSPEVLAKDPSDQLVIVLLAWNFADEITKKIKELRGDRDIFVRYFPKLEIIRPEPANETIQVPS